MHSVSVVEVHFIQQCNHLLWPRASQWEGWSLLLWSFENHLMIASWPQDLNQRCISSYNAHCNLLHQLFWSSVFNPAWVSVHRVATDRLVAAWEIEKGGALLIMMVFSKSWNDSWPQSEFDRKCCSSITANKLVRKTVAQCTSVDSVSAVLL